MHSIVDQLKKIVEDESDVTGFYEQSLAFIADRLNAQAVIVWDCSSLPYHPIRQYNRDPAQAIRVGISQERHLELLTTAVAREEAMISRERDAATGGDSFILLAAVPRGTSRDLIEVFVDCRQPSQVYQRNLADLQACCVALGEALSADSFSQRPLRSAPVPGTTSSSLFPIERFAQFTDQLHDSIDFRTTCFNVANESQSLLECDRVTVFRFDRRARVMAVSGLPKFNRRANLVTLQQQLATAVLKTGQTFWYPEPAAAIPPQISQPLDDYLSAGATRSLVLVPITAGREDRRPGSEPAVDGRPETVIGGLLMESFSGVWEKSRTRPSISLVSRNAVTAYRNAWQHRQLFLYPVWKRLGRLKQWSSPRYLPRTLLVLLLLAALLASLFLVPARITVSGTGVLVPETRRRVFADVAGRVDRIAVQHGSRVAAGDVLLTITSNDLQVRLNEVENRIALAEKQIAALDRRRMSTATRPADEMAEEDLERESLLAQLTSFREERALYLQEIDRLTVKSPIDGQVVTTDLQHRLLDRPVQTGQILMEIADTGGNWIVEVDLPDRRIGQLLSARRVMGEDVQATFMLAAEPGIRHRGTVSDVALATEVTSESGHTIPVQIRPDQPEALRIRQVATDVSVKIDCGRGSLGYVLFRDLGEFIQTRVLFYLR
jgi:multidrug efflux pump subunit AcrA (membrane-fusion protein)